ELTFVYAVETYGMSSPEVLGRWTRPGRHGLMAWKGRRFAVILPSVAFREGWSTEEYARAVMDKGSIKKSCFWGRFEHATWRSTPAKTKRVERKDKCDDLVSFARA